MSIFHSERVKTAENVKNVSFAVSNVSARCSSRFFPDARNSLPCSCSSIWRTVVISRIFFFFLFSHIQRDAENVSSDSWHDHSNHLKMDTGVAFNRALSVFVYQSVEWQWCIHATSSFLHLNAFLRGPLLCRRNLFSTKGHIKSDWSIKNVYFVGLYCLDLIHWSKFHHDRNLQLNN